MKNWGSLCDNNCNLTYSVANTGVQMNLSSLNELHSKKFNAIYFGFVFNIIPLLKQLMEAWIWGQLLENYQQINYTYLRDILNLKEENYHEEDNYLAYSKVNEFF